MSVIQQVEIEKIKIPRDRVTSIFDPEILDELVESIKARGILIPLNVLEVNGELWLIDGLHRLEAAKKLNMKTVPCLIKQGTEQDLYIENLIANRIRGKSNPVQEAFLIRKFVDEFGWKIKDVARRLGIAVYTASKLYDITKLPDEVLKYVEAGKLTVSKAWHLLQIPDGRDQIRAAEDIVKFEYNEAQVKELVKYYIERMSDIVETGARPTLVEPPSYTHCEICQEPMKIKATYHWLCDDCWELITTAMQQVAKMQEKQEEEKKEEAK